jgi:hypothetical protein
MTQGVTSFFLGNWTRNAASAFESIVETRGNDIGNLMVALGELRRVYVLQRVLITIVIVSVVLTGAIALTLAVMAPR